MVSAELPAWLIAELAELEAEPQRPELILPLLEPPEEPDDYTKTNPNIKIDV